jgi:hypothetical protein
MKYVLTLNKIKEHLIAPRFAFAQIFQLQGYEQLWNVWKHCECSKTINWMQNILPKMPYDDFSIEKKIKIQVNIYVKLHSS